MDRAVDSTPAEQGAVRSVHDRVDVQRRDVGTDDLDPAVEMLRHVQPKS